MRALALALLAGLLVPVSGCLSCQPQLDVHHCRGPTGRCLLGDAKPIAWNPDLDGLFPDIDRLLGSVAVGEHGHATWSEEQADAFWKLYQVDPDSADKQVFLTTQDDAGEQLFQVRVLEC